MKNAGLGVKVVGPKGWECSMQGVGSRMWGLRSCV